MSYTKLHSSMLYSTVWVGQPAHVRLVWVAFLLMADKNGEAIMSLPGVAQAAGVTLDEAREAVAILESPDPLSSTPDFEGRRIVPIDRGWELINHKKYRDLASKDDQKAKNAARQRRHRERAKKEA